MTELERIADLLDEAETYRNGPGWLDSDETAYQELIVKFNALNTGGGEVVEETEIITEPTITEPTLTDLQQRQLDSLVARGIPEEEAMKVVMDTSSPYQSDNETSQAIQEKWKRAIQDFLASTEANKIELEWERMSPEMRKEYEDSAAWKEWVSFGVRFSDSALPLPLVGMFLSRYFPNLKREVNLTLKGNPGKADSAEIVGLMIGLVGGPVAAGVAARGVVDLIAQGPRWAARVAGELIEQGAKKLDDLAYDAVQGLRYKEHTFADLLNGKRVRALHEADAKRMRDTVKSWRELFNSNGAINIERTRDMIQKELALMQADDPIKVALGPRFLEDFMNNKWVKDVDPERWPKNFISDYITEGLELKVKNIIAKWFPVSIDVFASTLGTIGSDFIYAIKQQIIEGKDEDEALLGALVYSIKKSPPDAIQSLFYILGFNKVATIMGIGIAASDIDVDGNIITGIDDEQISLVDVAIRVVKDLGNKAIESLESEGMSEGGNVGMRRKMNASRMNKGGMSFPHYENMKAKFLSSGGLGTTKKSELPASQQAQLDALLAKGIPLAAAMNVIGIQGGTVGDKEVIVNEVNSILPTAREVLEFVPVIGDILAAEELVNELMQDDINWTVVGILGAGLAIGVIPGVGDLIAKGGKIAADAVKNGGEIAAEAAGKGIADTVGVARAIRDGDTEFLSSFKGAEGTASVGARVAAKKKRYVQNADGSITETDLTVKDFIAEYGGAQTTVQGKKSGSLPQGAKWAEDENFLKPRKQPAEPLTDVSAEQAKETARYLPRALNKADDVDIRRTIDTALVDEIDVYTAKNFNEGDLNAWEHGDPEFDEILGWTLPGKRKDGGEPLIDYNRTSKVATEIADKAWPSIKSKLQDKFKDKVSVEEMNKILLFARAKANTPFSMRTMGTVSLQDKFGVPMPKGWGDKPTSWNSRFGAKERLRNLIEGGTGGRPKGDSPRVPVRSGGITRWVDKKSAGRKKTVVVETKRKRINLPPNDKPKSGGIIDTHYKRGGIVG